MDTGQLFNRNALKIVLITLVVAVVGMLLGGAGYAYADSPRILRKLPFYGSGAGNVANIQS